MSWTTRERADHPVESTKDDATRDDEATRFPRRRRGPTPMTREEMLAMQGTGWDGDLDEMRSAPFPWDR